MLAVSSQSFEYCVYELLLIRDSGIRPHVFMWHIIPWQQMHGLANVVMRLLTHLNIHFINKFFYMIYIGGRLYIDLQLSIM